MGSRALVHVPADERLHVSWWDRLLISIAPDWGLRRVRARATAQVLARHYEAAQGGRRTSGWQRYATDANAANGPALTALRELARDLRRNNGWARRGIQAIVNNVVGWGIMPKPGDRSRARSRAALELWNAWASSTACDFDGRQNFYGLQRLAMETIAESGEVIIVRQPATTADGLAIPMRLQVLEADYLDTSRNGQAAGDSGGPIIDGVEFDRQGRRVAYWLFTSHPGAQRLARARFESVRTPADRVLHVYRVDRPGQVRGVPWLAPAITRLKDLDDFEDAELMQQKVAACFGAFVTDEDGGATAVGGPESTGDDGYQIEQLEPGHIAYLPPGKKVTFAQPPKAQDTAFSVRALRRIAVSIGVPYEEITGDYSQVNYSSARMARLAHWANVHEWREHMIIPQLCGGVWRWAMQLVEALEGWPAAPAAQWAAPPMPILEPDKEGLAYQRLVRIGAMTWPQMVRELGEDPVAQLDEIAALNKELDQRGIVLDCDPRKTTVGGQMQSTTGAPPPSEDDPDDDPADDDRARRALAVANPDPGFSARRASGSSGVRELLGREDFVEAYGEETVTELATAAASFLEYADPSSVASAISILYAHRHVLDDIMDRLVDRPLFRGLSVDRASVLDREPSAPVPYEALSVAESWTASEAMARSFAMSPSWHAEDRRPIGVVLRVAAETLAGEDVLLPPASKIARWFEAEIKARMTGDVAAKERNAEREYLLLSRRRPTTVVHRGEIRYPKAVEDPEPEPESPAGDDPAGA